jgi:exodeoxyribonuclease VII large subunit
LLPLLADLGGRLERALLSELGALRSELSGVKSSLSLHSPRNTIRNDRQRLDELSRRATTALTHSIALRRVQVDGWERRLQALSPQSVLERGYAVVTRPDGALVASATQVTAGDAIHVRLSDGAFGARVEPSEA